MQKRTNVPKDELADFLPPIHFPEVKELRELFDRITLYEKEALPSYYLVENATQAMPARGPKRSNEVPIGPYCIRSSDEVPHKGLSIYPNERLADWVQKNMIYIQYDTMHFKIIDYRDGMSLVIISYGQIIGERWLAMVQTESIDAMFESVGV